MSKSFETKIGSKQLKVKGSIVWALTFAFLIAVWLLSGQLNRTPPSQMVEGGEATEAAPAASSLTRVRVKTIEAVPHEVELTIRGRTQALRSVQVRAETQGRVVALPVEKGADVEEGTVLCELAVDARAAQMQEARAKLSQRKLEWDAAKMLQKQGHRSETHTASVKAGYDAAQASVMQKEVEMSRTKIRAPYAGIFNDRQVEIGDYMSPGQVCGIVVDQNPWLVIGEVSEQDIAYMKAGDRGRAKLVNGKIVTGTIRYLSSSANMATRTFRVELEIIDESGAVFRDGITADLVFPLGVAPAHYISPAILGLNTRGDIGVRTVDDNGIVAFTKIKIVSDTTDGVWITGLPAVATVITVGQEMVNPGEKVIAVEEQQLVEGGTSAAPTLD
jgi:multidrug efflux system membrane fusion protein